MDEENLTVLREAESKVVPESTQKQTKNHVKRFKQYLLKKNLPDEIETLPIPILENYLSFFNSLETKEGHPYSPASLICFRASIQRKNHKKMKIDANAENNTVTITFD